MGQKIVINPDFGGFVLSGKTLEEYRRRSGCEEIGDWDVPRDCPILVEIVERDGRKSGGPYSRLVVVEIPDGVNWEIDSYDGAETIHEKHRVWGEKGEIT